MKRCVLFLFLATMVFSIAFISAADVEVGNVSLKENYGPDEEIEGFFYLTLEDYPYNTHFSSDLGERMALGEFLELNYADYSCTPLDCENSYLENNAEGSKSFSLSSGEDYYVGMYLEGDNVDVNDFSFDLSSDFEESEVSQLRINFFEGANWRFEEYSDSSFSDLRTGCFDSVFMEYGPLIGTSPYCERIYIPQTDKVNVGAYISGEDSKNLRATIYTTDIGSPVAQASYNASEEEDVLITFDEELPSDDYYVCISASESTNYKIAEEEDNETCGYFDMSFSNSTKDYGIYVSTPLYGSADAISFSESDLDSFVEEADAFILAKYGGDCSSGCVLPIRFEGISQNVDLSNFRMVYNSNEGTQEATQLYDLDVGEAVVDFEGSLDAGFFGFEAVDGLFNLYLDDEEILDSVVNVNEATSIRAIYPLDPPASVEVNFYAVVDDPDLVSYYFWDFGDGTTMTTQENVAKHVYYNLSDYTLKLKAFSTSNASSEETFSVSPVNPKDAVEQKLDILEGYLDDARDDLLKLPFWYRDFVEEKMNLVYYETELSRLNRSFNAAFEEEDYVEVAQDLYVLDFPRNVYVFEESTMPLLTDLEDINPEPVASIAGGVSGEDLSGYKNPILRWQTDNVNSLIKMQRIAVAKESGIVEVVVVANSVDLEVNAAEESYFIVGMPRESLYFSDESGIRKQGDSTALILGENADEKIEFYYEGSEQAPMFVSPKLSRLTLEAPIEPCNYNEICEENLGENTDNCRNDCKPVGSMIFWMILIFFFILVLYTALQIWYKTRYEGYLFSDRRHLYNILMFISNARAKGKSDMEIREMLLNKGWSKEQVGYALKKSRGERTGMYEIVPVEKLVAYYHDFMAKRKVKENPKAKPAYKSVGKNLPHHFVPRR